MSFCGRRKNMCLSGGSHAVCFVFQQALKMGKVFGCSFSRRLTSMFFQDSRKNATIYEWWMFMDSPLPCLPIKRWGSMVILSCSVMQCTERTSSSLCHFACRMLWPIQIEMPNMTQLVVHNPVMILDPCPDDAPSCWLLFVDWLWQSWSGCITGVVDQSQNLSHSLWTHFDW